MASGDGRGSKSSTAAEQPLYQGTGTVLESPDHGPQLCFVVLDSYPPQCDGPDLIGWDWDAAERAESANGTTWGSYTVVGTWDGVALTVTEPPRIPDPAAQDTGDDDRLRTPCPEPAGGWRPVEEAAATQEALNRAIQYARSQPDVGGVWLDQSINPAASEESLDERAMNDPAKLVLNMSFTGALKHHEAAVRELWGGALCVSEAAVSAAELAELRAQVERDVGEYLWSSTDERTGTIEISVIIDDGLQERLDGRYGEGVVEVHAELEPVRR